MSGVKFRGVKCRTSDFNSVRKYFHVATASVISKNPVILEFSKVRCLYQCFLMC